jgi:predicted nucleotidyltransferase
VKRDEAIRILTANRDRLREFPIRSLAIFGSVARDEATDTSDVDMLVDFEPGARIGLFRLIEIKQFLEGLLGCPVDLGTADTLRQRIREQVLKEAIRVA